MFNKLKYLLKDISTIHIVESSKMTNPQERKFIFYVQYICQKDPRFHTPAKE
jgi:hypothetical protein